MVVTLKTIKEEGFWNFLSNVPESLFLSFRSLLFSFRKPLKVGFLRVKNEENTIIPCLMSIEKMLDKIVLIYADNDDRTIELIYDYIKKNNLQNKYIMSRYPHKVFPQAAKEYFEHNYKWENSLAAYYEFGFEICKKLARFRNGFICKIDADQIYMPECFDDILKIMKSQKYKYVQNSYGGLNGYVLDGMNYAINYGYDVSGRNGSKGDN